MASPHAQQPVIAPHLVEPRLENVTDESFQEYCAAVSRGFQETYHPETLDLDRAVFDNDRTFGFKVGQRWVATCADFARSLTVPGGAVAPVAAVTVVTVHPPYRRRGLLSAMMRHQLEQVAGRGEPLAALWASESMIYGRFGYGPAVGRSVLSGSTRSLGYLPGTAISGSCDEVSREQYLAAAPDLHRAMRKQRPGTMSRNETQWQLALFDLEFARRGSSELHYVLHYDEAGEPDGFATYRFKEKFGEDPEGEVQIKDLWAEAPEAYAGLWRYLLDLDLARTFQWWNGATDEPLRHLVADARAVRTSVTDSLYVRVVDVAAALTAREYAAPVDMVIAVEDPLLPDNTGCYRLHADGSSGSSGAGRPAEVARVDETPDLSMGIRELGTVYLGGVPLEQLHRVGRVTEHTPGAVAAASTAFGWSRAPWCPDMF